jgi:DNA-binding MarR family transcriptional regulator/N-acetylglutamate synthase-like GNAT family acetyltransferase
MTAHASSVNGATITPPHGERSAVAIVRAFNRYYTGVIGVLDDGLLRTPYSLIEARVIFELAQRDRAEVTELRRGLGLDAGYLSRLLTRLDENGLVVRERSDEDGRRQLVALTDQGRQAYDLLDRRSAEQIGALLEPLPEPERNRLLGAMSTIATVLDRGAGRPASPATIVIRSPRPGDLGWVVQRHGELYAAEYGWDASFEHLVMRIVADSFANTAESTEPAREAAWIAELDGERAGCVFCTSKDARTAQLRLLLVEPWARGHGLGGRLVEECLRFARAAGYAEIVLWTNGVLDAARRIYERAGFTLVESEPHHSFGHDLVGQYWRRDV